MNLNELINDDKTSSAIIMKFGIIGEATKHLPDELKEKHPQIPWKNMSGMRDRLIHAYFGIDHDLVWKAIETEIPKLKSQLKKILREFEKE